MNSMKPIYMVHKYKNEQLDCCTERIADDDEGRRGDRHPRVRGVREGASSGSKASPEDDSFAHEAPSEPLMGFNAGLRATRKLTSVQRFGPQGSMLVNKRPAFRGPELTRKAVRS